MTWTTRALAGAEMTTRHRLVICYSGGDFLRECSCGGVHEIIPAGQPLALTNYHHRLHQDEERS